MNRDFPPAASPITLLLQALDLKGNAQIHILEDTDFSLAKLVKLAKPISKSTFDSISRPWDNPESVLEQVAKIKWDLPSLVQRYLPRVSTIPLHQGMCWEPTWKAIPNMAFFSDYMIRGAHVKQQWSQGLLWIPFTRFALDKENKMISGWCLDQFEKTIGPTLPTPEEFGCRPITGRLGQLIEGGGKRRIFAIGNYVNQRLLHPIHQWLNEVLQMIPMDGTLKPSLLTACNLFDIPFVKLFSQISFVAGQPLGYHASWPLFALSHHILVWHCAEPSLGLSISYQKSLISHTGSAEFAKRFRVRDLSKDLSPISAQALLNSHHPYGTIAVQLQYPMRRFSTMCRVGGIGFRVLSRLDHSRSLRVERLLAMYTKTTLPIELWLGRGLPLNPYARGVIIELLRKELRPKETTSGGVALVLRNKRFISLSGRC
ncbi:hypothetical protein QYF36_018578 [Acer negundo]|nr:hypothetical protein QYF36_018578 [Acer negundo]